MLEEAIAEAKTIKETAIASAKAALEEAFQPQLTALFAEKLNEMEEEEEMKPKKSMDENDSLDELDLEEILAELESDNMNEEDLDDQPLEEDLMLEEMSDEDIEELVTKVIDDMIASGKLVAGEESEEDLEDEDDIEDFDLDAVEDDTDTVDEELDIDALLAEISGDLEEEVDTDLEEILAEMDRLDEESELEEARKSKKDEEDEELKEAYEAIATLRAELNEVNLLNAKLLYTNKIFKAKNLTESEKVKVLNTFDKAETVKEVKLVFETLTESLKAPVAKKNPIKESLGGASKTVVVEQKQEQIIEVNDAFARMQRLAGLRK